MKTLEERAKEIFPDAFDADEIIPTREGYIVEQQRRGYRIGAAEQKKIDIDKACEWWENNLPITTVEEARSLKWKVITPENLKVLVGKFRKAMEE